MGLEDQLLAKLSKLTDQPLKNRRRNSLTNKISTKSLVDYFLMLSSSACDDILSDSALVENLEHTKKTAAEIETKVSEAKKTSYEIYKAGELFRPAAARASVLYFILNDLNKINPMYQFSLKAFGVVFDVAIQQAVMDTDIVTRVKDLTDSITFQVFQYTTRGLFECDKLIFTAQMAFQTFIINDEINPEELDFLLRFPTTTNTTSPEDFNTNSGWGSLNACLAWNSSETWIGLLRIMQSVGATLYRLRHLKKKSFHRNGRKKMHCKDYV